MADEAIHYLDVDVLTLSPQIRTRPDDALVPELAASIRAIGLMHPLRVRRQGDRFMVLDGERRLRAVRLLGWPRVAVVLEEN